MQPIILQTKFFMLHTFAILVAVAIIAGMYTMVRLSLKNSLKLQFLSDISWKLIFFGLLGARVFNIISNYQSYFYEISISAFLNLFAFWDKGLNIWGGVLGSLIYLHLICKKSEQNFWKWLDVIVPSLIIAFSISHIGAFFEGINYGNETSLPWGVNFESPSIKYAVPIHPTQIYAFIYSILIAIGLIFLSHTHKIENLEKPGFIGNLGITAYSFLYFLENFVRGDDTLEILTIRVPQIMAFLIFIITGAFLYIRYNRPEMLKLLVKKARHRK